MRNFKLTGTKLAKSFEQGRNIFSGIELHITNGEIIAITGENGSGKSTLMKILAGALRPTSGTLDLEVEGKKIERDNIFRHVGFVSPYLNLYEEFTPLELLEIFSKIRGIKFDEGLSQEHLKMFNLHRRRDDPIRKFSSGMKQRMKYILALQEDTELLYLDEPMSNLDADGISAVLNLILEHREKGGGVIIATNEERDKALAKRIVFLGNKIPSKMV